MTTTAVPGFTPPAGTPLWGGQAEALPLPLSPPTTEPPAAPTAPPAAATAAAAPAPRTVAELVSLTAMPDSPETAIHRLVEHLAQAGGSDFLEHLKRSGHSEATVIAAAEQPTDKRRHPKVKADRIGGDLVVWLTAAGWKAAGHERKSERRPTSETLGHADAPGQVRRWLHKRVGAFAEDHVAVEVVTDPAAITTFSDAVQSRAWARITGPQGSGDGIGPLKNGLRPDALVVERWWQLNSYAQYHHVPQKPHPTEPGKQVPDVDLDDLAERTYALEVETTAKSDPMLKEKVLRLDGAMSLGSIVGVVWLVRTAEVARRLRAFHIGDASSPRPGHFFVPAITLGLPGDLMPAAGPQWWPLALPGA